jgi:hypothetical protein
MSSAADKNDDDEETTKDGVLTPLLDSLGVAEGPHVDAVRDLGVVGVAVEFSRFRICCFIFEAVEEFQCASFGYRGVLTAKASRAATIGLNFSKREVGTSSCIGDKRGRVID